MFIQCARPPTRSSSACGVRGSLLGLLQKGARGPQGVKQKMGPITQEQKTCASLRVRILPRLAVVGGDRTRREGGASASGAAAWLRGWGHGERRGLRTLRGRRGVAVQWARRGGTRGPLIWPRGRSSKKCTARPRKGRSAAGRARSCSEAQGPAEASARAARTERRGREGPHRCFLHVNKGSRGATACARGRMSPPTPERSLAPGR